MKENMRVKDKVIIVTGAGSGIGSVMAAKLASEGAIVIVNDINTENGNRIANDIINCGNRAEFVYANMTKTEEVKNLMQHTVQQYGRIDVVVNNVGWTHFYQPALDVPEEEFDKCYDTNIKSLYLSTMHAVPIFRKQGIGNFINIGSTAGLRPPPGLTWYNGSKAALIITSKSLAAELGPENIRVNVINPGFNPNTNLSESFAGGPLTKERIAVRIAAIPMRRFVTSEDIANAALYLASDDSAFINGVCIEVDGGRSI
jgi:3-oxoacyl-[acyl-carrier protein] reductase